MIFLLLVRDKYSYFFISRTETGLFLVHQHAIECDMCTKCTTFKQPFLCTTLCKIGAVFALMNHPTVCQEMVRDLLLDLPLLSSPIILLCMNKELRNQCMLLLQRNPASHYIKCKTRKSVQQTSVIRTCGETDTAHL